MTHIFWPSKDNFSFTPALGFPAKVNCLAIDTTSIKLGYGVKTADGKNWSKPFQLEGTYGHYIWRAATHNDKAYLCARRKRGYSEKESGAGATPIMESAMLESDDGINWRYHSLFQKTKGNETAFLFRQNGELLAISRSQGREPALLVQANHPIKL